MASLMETLKKDQLQARKNKDNVTASLLTTLISEAAMIGKNDGNRETTDLEVVRVVKKFVANIEETLKIRNDEKLQSEKRILEDYLPRQLTEDDIKSFVAVMIIKSQLASDPLTQKDFGKIMKALQAEHPGCVDGKLASQVIKEILV